MPKKTSARPVQHTVVDPNKAVATNHVGKFIATPEQHQLIKVAAAMAGRSVRDFAGRVICDALAPLAADLATIGLPDGITASVAQGTE